MGNTLAEYLKKIMNVDLIVILNETLTDNTIYINSLKKTFRKYNDKNCLTGITIINNFDEVIKNNWEEYIFNVRQFNKKNLTIVSASSITYFLSYNTKDCLVRICNNNSEIKKELDLYISNYEGLIEEYKHLNIIVDKNNEENIIDNKRRL